MQELKPLMLTDCHDVTKNGVEISEKQTNKQTNKQINKQSYGISGYLRVSKKLHICISRRFANLRYRG